MKIIKTFSKSKSGFISALCINIGPNTFKANQYSNIMYFLERKKQNNNIYNLFGERKKIFVYIIIDLVVSTVGTLFYFYYFLNAKHGQTEVFKSYLPQIIIAVICKSLMSVFFIIQNFIVFFSLIQLNKNNIVCFDTARLSKR